MNSMMMSIGLSLLLSSVSVHAADSSSTGLVPPVYEREAHAHDGHSAQGNHEPGVISQAPDHKGEHKAGRGHTGHPEPGGHEHTEQAPAEVHLTRDQIQALEIRTERLEPRTLGETLQAPGEVRLNAYASAQVAPRITAQVSARHVRLGSRVQVGQPMVTLSSVEMAEAQGNLVVAEREWQRVRELGRRVVSEGRYLEAQIARQQARARVIAFGMTPGQVEELLHSGGAKADGTFVLLAPQAGTVIADDFVLGEVVEAGQTLFEVTDESVRWVEARMTAEEVARVSVGDAARVSAGSVWLDGKVTQIHHRIDEHTRTQAVRVAVPDPDHRLHPGIFVDVEVYVGRETPVLAVPEAAVLRRPDGDWLVFVATDEAGSYRPSVVELARTTGGLAVIDGLACGTEVVVQGAFFLQSELAKSGFDIHQH